MAKNLSQMFIKIDGQDVSSEFMTDLIEVVVDTSLHLPDMFSILLKDAALKWVDDAMLDIGKPVEISAEAGEELSGATGALIKGEITAIEPIFMGGEGETSVLLIRGYDKSHRLHRGKKTRTFLKQTDSAIVQKVAGEVGLSPQADSPGITYDYVLQNNQTNMEFLLTRAERIGYRVFAADGNLYFKKGDFSLGDGPELELGSGLLSFQPCWTGTHQANKVVVKSWDPKKKETIESQATPNSSLRQGGMQKTGGDATKSAFGEAEMVVTDHPVFTVDEAKALAEGLRNDIDLEFVEAEGKCMGDPRVKAGWKVTIKKVGDRFSGKYFVTSATHIYNQEDYITKFSITGRQPDTISHLLHSRNGHEQGMGMVQGVVTGLVTNLDDPDNLGRVKVKYAWLYGTEGDIESDWVRIATPMAGAERGFYYLPEINDEVLVAFEHGDVHRPHIVGYLWSSTDKPPKPNSEVAAGGKTNERIIKSRSGHVIILDDTDGAEQIIIRDKTEKNEIIIDSVKNDMLINVGNDVIIEAKGKIQQKSQSDRTIESQTKLTLKSTSNMEINSGANLTLKATGQLKIQGAQVQVAGDAMTEIKGGIVKLN